MWAEKDEAMEIFKAPAGESHENVLLAYNFLKFRFSNQIIIAMSCSVALFPKVLITGLAASLVNSP